MKYVNGEGLLTALGISAATFTICFVADNDRRDNEAKYEMLKDSAVIKAQEREDMLTRWQDVLDKDQND